MDTNSPNFKHSIHLSEAIVWKVPSSIVSLREDNEEGTRFSLVGFDFVRTAGKSQCPNPLLRCNREKWHVTLDYMNMDFIMKVVDDDALCTCLP